MVVSLLIDDLLKQPETWPDGQLRIRVRLPVREIRLISGFARPMDYGDSDDWRRLGVALLSLRWEQGGATIDVPIESSAFIDGFDHLELDATDGVPFRWTNGDAALPPSLFPPWRGETLLYLNVKTWVGSSAQTPLRWEARTLHAFESLGDNCELALAQRHFGVELPLSLLRWSGTNYEKLVRGLECRFEGLGDLDTTEVTWDSTDYRLQTPYFQMHTTVIEQRDAAGVAEILRHGCVTLRLLRRKLLRDIADARRIFVFRSADPAVAHPEMRRLHAALRAIGPASLLCVTQQGPDQPSGVVERLADGLYAGYLEKFVIPDGPFDVWATLCSRVLNLHRATRSQGYQE